MGQHRPMDEIVIVAAGIEPLPGSSFAASLERIGGRTLLDALVDEALVASDAKLTVLHGDAAIAQAQERAHAGLIWKPCEGPVGAALAEVLAGVEAGARVLVVHGASVSPQAGAMAAALGDLPAGQTHCLGGDTAVAAVVTHGGMAPAADVLAQQADAGAALRVLAGAGAGHVAAVDAPGWQRVANKWTLGLLERDCQAQRVRALCEAGLTVADPYAVAVRGTLTFGRDVRVDRNVLFEGDVVLGDGVTVGANCILRDVRIGAGTEVKPFCELDGASLGPGSRVGPYARLRPGAHLGEGAQIGNFVEIKEAAIGRGARIGHLAFVGDAQLEDDVTIGAGSITCNHDGVQRNRTLIREGAFIGSGVELVAPVEVGAGATVGSGSTITADVPARKLAVARARQSVVKGWKGPKSTRK